MTIMHHHHRLAVGARLVLLVLLPAGLWAQTAADSLLRGSVTDLTSGEPIAFATVYCEACNYGGTVTNERGEFVLEAAPAGTELQVRHLLYGEVRIVVPPGDVPLRIGMRPLTVTLPEVVVDGREGEALLLAAYDRLQAQGAEAYRGEGFYRQISRVDTTWNELLEAFCSVELTNQGLTRWKVKTGRYAKHPAMPRLIFTNFSYLTRGIRIYRDAYEPGRVITPLVRGAARFYDIRVEKTISSEAGPIVVIDCTPTAGAPQPILGGRLYLDAQNYRLHRVEWEATEPIATVSTGQANLTIPSSRTSFVLSFRPTDNGNVLLEYAAVRTLMSLHEGGEFRFDWEVRSLYLGLQTEPRQRTGKPRVKRDRYDFKEIAGAKYDPAWWQRHPVVAPTPAEQAVIDAFDRERYIGNYFEEE